MNGVCCPSERLKNRVRAGDPRRIPNSRAVGSHRDDQFPKFGSIAAIRVVGDEQSATLPTLVALFVVGRNLGT